MLDTMGVDEGDKDQCDPRLHLKLYGLVVERIGVEILHHAGVEVLCQVQRDGRQEGGAHIFWNAVVEHGLMQLLALGLGQMPAFCHLFEDAIESLVAFRLSLKLLKKCGDRFLKRQHDWLLGIVKAFCQSPGPLHQDVVLFLQLGVMRPFGQEGEHTVVVLLQRFRLFADGIKTWLYNTMLADQRQRILQLSVHQPPHYFFVCPCQLVLVSHYRILKKCSRLISRVPSLSCRQVSVIDLSPPLLTHFSNLPPGLDGPPFMDTVSLPTRTNHQYT